MSKKPEEILEQVREKINWWQNDAAFKAPECINIDYLIDLLDDLTETANPSEDKSNRPKLAMKYGLLKTQGLTDVVVKVKGEQKDGIDSDNPRYACILMGTIGMPERVARSFRETIGFSLDGFGYPWQSSVEFVEFESDQQAEDSAREMLVNLRAKDTS